MKKYFLLFTILFLQIIIYPQEVALSFDDAPRGDGAYFTGLERTKTLIKDLKEANVKQVIFYCVTNQIDTIGNKRLEMYSNAGYLIANHSDTHRSLDNISAKEYIKDIQRADSILKKYKTYTKLFRYPYLHEGKTIEKRDSVRNALSKMNYRNGYVTIDDYDWYIAKIFKDAYSKSKQIDFENFKNAYVNILWEGIKFYDDMAKKVLGRSPKHVLLLHENDVAALFIKDLIKHIRESGGKIISPAEAYKDPIADYIPNVLMNNQGRIAAIAKEKDYKEKYSHVSESDEYLDKYFNENGIIK